MTASPGAHVAAARDLCSTDSIPPGAPLALANLLTIADPLREAFAAAVHIA